MKVSEFYSLGRKQNTLDFLDVDIIEDIPVFIDPRGIEILPSEWGDRCVSLIQSFFSTVINCIKDGEDQHAQSLLNELKEPNEVHLGLSSGRSRGRGLGTKYAEKIWKALCESEAIKSGLISDLEDTILMIYGIGPDLISDITMNIIRGPLIEYTQETCLYHNIPLEENIYSGPLWNPIKKEWFTDFVSLPTPNKKLILIPKAIVRLNIFYDAYDYYNNYLLQYLRSIEFSANSSLVQLLKNGKRRVTNKDLMDKYGRGKQAIVKLSNKYPEVFENYKAEMKGKSSKPLYHDQLAFGETFPVIDWDNLLQDVINIKAGKSDAKKYEKVIEALLTALFYPSLTNPYPQVRLHDGLKIVDIRYTNMANSGFFKWLSNNYSAANIWIECKNYSGNISNPEFDQMLGRFSESRGVVGFILCRKITNQSAALNRCRAIVGDARRYMVVIEDSDIKKLVKSKKEHGKFDTYQLLHDKFQEIIS